MSSRTLIAFFCCLLACTGCNFVYKQNIQQGNAIEQDKLDQLKAGMTMTQVAYLLGTPAVRDPFHQDRWDYIYTFALRGGKQTSRKVTLYFENAILKEMIGVNEPEMAATGSKSGDKADKQAAAEEVQAPAAADMAPEPAAEPVTTAIATPEAADSPATTVEPADVMPQTGDAGSDEAAAVTEEAETPASAEFVKPLPAGIPLAEEDPDGYIVQLGAYDSLANARNLVDRLRDAGFDASVYMQVVEGLGPRFLVRSPGYDSRPEAERQLQQINSSLELDGFLIIPAGN